VAQSTLAQQLAGKFLVVDGPDGAGKSTQLRRLQQWLAGQGVNLLVTRDPGGTAIGDRVRTILLDPGAGEMSVECEIMLYMASRAQLIDQVVRPALAAGQCVLCDRFVSATVAYQGAGGANTADIIRVADVAIGHTWPGLTIILDIDPQHGLNRVKRGLDRMEAKGLDFHRRVRDGFLTQARENPDRFTVVDALADEETVFTRLRTAIETWLAAH
jgi:dTMP kinase